MLKENRKYEILPKTVDGSWKQFIRVFLFFKTFWVILVSIFSFCQSSVNGQVQVYPVSVITQLTPPYSVNLADHAAPGCEQLKVIIVQRDLTQAPYRLYLKMEIELNGRIIIRTPGWYVPPALSLEPGIPTVISGTELSRFLEPQNMDFVGYSRDAYLRSKVLPEGAYTITFTAYDWTRRDVALSKGGSIFCYLAKTDPPILNLPFNNSLVAVSSPQYINFHWLSHSTSPNSAQSTRYRFELFEMRANGSYPSEIVQNSRPLFTSETDRTDLTYSISEPPLEKGVRYAWRVKAFDTQNRDYIRNDGYSEVFCFLYGDAGGVTSFDEIESFNAQAVSPREVKLTWDASSGYDRYKVYYRKKGDNNKWYESETIRNNAEIKGLSPEVVYECRVQGKRSNIWGNFSMTDTVMLPSLPKINCGSPFQPLAVINREPLLELMKMQQFDAGGFTVTSIDPFAANIRPGRFSGKGFVQVPLFGHKKIRCEFSDIFINTDYQMVEGSVRLLCDKTQGGDNAIWDIDEVFEGGLDNGKIIEGTEGVAVSIPDVVIAKPEELILDTLRKEILIVNESNDTIHINISEKLDKNPKTVTLKDSEGNLYSIDTHTGKTTSIGKFSQGGSQQQLTSLPSVLDNRIGVVYFEPVRETRYAFDKRNSTYARSNLFSEEYRTMKVEDGTLYDVPFKLIPSGETDVVLARAEYKGKKIKPDSIVFISATGTRYSAKPEGKEGQYLLNLPSGNENDGIEVFATYPGKNGKSVVLGKLIVISYSVKHPKVTLVPVNSNGTDIDPVAIKKELDSIYIPVAIDWQVSMDNSQFQASANNLDVTGSNLFSQYTDGMKNLNNAFIAHKKEEFDPSAIYLFLLQHSGDQNTTGDMPRSRQFGYIFTKTAAAGGNEALCRTIAHEIAHGAFHLNHTFDSQYQIEQGTTDNLLDYTVGTDLVKHQWDAIHDPGLVIGMFERDEEGAMIRTEDDDFQSILKLMSYSGVNTFVFGIRCQTGTNDNLSLYSGGYRFYFLKYKSKVYEEKLEITLLDKNQFPAKELYSKIQVPKFAIPSTADKLLILNKEIDGIVTPFLCNVNEDYPDACKIEKLTDIAGFYDRIRKDISNCILQKDIIMEGGLTLSAITDLLQSLQSEARTNQQFEFIQNGQVYALNAQNQAELMQTPELNEDINDGNWNNNSIEMKMRVSYDPSGILQLEALGINKNLILATGKTASLIEVSENMLLKVNILLKDNKVKNVGMIPAMTGAKADSEEFPDKKRVDIDENASFFKIICEAGGVGLTFLKTTEIEQPVYLEGQENTIKAPPICTGSLEGAAMAVTDITSMVITVHDLVLDKEVRKNAVNGFVAIKNQIKDDPSLLFPILGEVILQEFTGSNTEGFSEISDDNTNIGRKGHLISKTTVRTGASVFASGKFLAKLPDLAIQLAAKIPKAKLWLRFRSIDDALSANLLKRFESLPDGGNKFLDDFVTSSDEELGKFLKNPELIDAWKKMNDFKAEDALRKNLGALDALSKPKFDRPDPKTYLSPKYIDDHLKKFEGGVTKFISDVPTGAIGPPSGTFVIPKTQADDLIKQAGGDVYKLEDLLGLDRGMLGSKPMRIDVDVPSGLRMSHGNEVGANNKWIPGGRTSKGILEATVDQIQQGTFITKFVF